MTSPAVQRFVKAVEAAELSASNKLRAAASTIQSMIATSCRDRDLALRAGKRAVRACGDTLDWWSAVAGCAFSGGRLINGEVEGSVADLVRLSGGPGLPLLDPLYRPVFAQGLVSTELTRGRLDQARQWITLMEQSVAESRGGEVLANREGHIALCWAAVHMAAGEPRRAVEWARKAALTFGAIDHVLQEVECREVLGAALAASGDAAAAISELTEAAKLYEACHLPGRRDGVYRQLRALGYNAVAPRRSTVRATLPHLTARETEVARLIADGLTNKEIMQRLQLSRRTVETHISNIRAKLDVASRAALAAAVVCAGQTS